MPLLQPDLYCRSVADLDFEELERRGVRMLLFDLDNTLVRRNTEEGVETARACLEDARARGMGACIVSNNWHERVQETARRLGVPIVGKATKPLGSGFRRAIEGTGLTSDQCAVVGDQVFTDILGGNLFGATTVLVVPLAGGSDLPHTRVLRALERRILKGRVPRDGVSGDTTGE